MIWRRLIRWGAYPVIFGGCALAFPTFLHFGIPYWPFYPATAMVGIVAVAFLEWIQPYERVWLDDHDDTRADLLHAATNLFLISVTAESVAWVRQFVPLPIFWPVSWPKAFQMVLAGGFIDFGLWLMHRLSHHFPWLWKFHALHHSSQRLYWLNGERRHPVSAILLAGPGLAVVTLFGAPADAIGGWMALIAVHLAFQHANLDYRLGWFRNLLGVAEVHRWHHKREFQDAQVNFGEFWMIWDHLFGTFLVPISKIGPDEVGIKETDFPRKYLSQLFWPFETLHK